MGEAEGGIFEMMLGARLSEALRASLRGFTQFTG